MLSQLLFENAHFALNLIAGLVFTAAFWLHLDAWAIKPSRKDLSRWLGFLSLALAFLFHATVLERDTLGIDFSFSRTAEVLAFVGKVLGYGLLVVSQLFDPLQPRPETKGLESVTQTPTLEKQPSILLIPGSIVGKLTLPLLSLMVGLLYLRRATVGLERHLRPVAIGFLLIFGHELFSVASLWRESLNPNLALLTAPFRVFWIVEHLLLVAGLIVIGRWVWMYLVTRIRNQLFMIFTTATVVIFLLTTVSFTFLLLRNIAKDATANLTTAVRVLEYAIDGKKSETLAHAEMLSQQPKLAEALLRGDHASISTLTNGYLERKRLSTLVVTDAEGQVLHRAEDTSRRGESISSDPLITRALIGDVASSIASQENVVAPAVSIRSTAPVRSEEGLIVGTVMVGVVLSNEFTDSLKKSTGLEAAIYSGLIRSATTFVAADGKSRLIGVKESSPDVQKAVMENGTIFTGTIRVASTPYVSAYAPLKDVDNEVVGMLYVGKPELHVMQTAAKSIELTFIIAALLLLFSAWPIYGIARQIAKQLN